MAKKVKRLYNEFKPKHYQLELHADRDAMTFTGTVVITGHKQGRPSKRFVFHQNGLKITSATVTHHHKHGNIETLIDRINKQDKLDEVRLHSPQLIYPGEYTITLEFSGTITRPMNGIYPCFFTSNNKDLQLVATQFESHHAREAFPCIDEPEAKATFELSLTSPADEAVISNTPIASQTKSGKQVITTFEKTPKMSTYLLAFIFGDLEFLEAKTRQGVVVRAYATPDNVQYTQFALDTAVKCLEFYNDYFDHPYPLKKLDMIALPDFASAAMENWGAVTYREQAMLVDPNNTSVFTKQHVAMVVAHELAHMWFGNLVTMRWWTDLWLNEGFASWIEFLAVDHIFPKWEMWTQFITDDQQQALKLDALVHTHPIEVPINHPDEIRTNFDTISYSKGASIIHMLNEYLGAEHFKNGLRNYLKKHEYANTDTVDLWDALEETSKKPVKEFMHAWTSQGGYPVVSAEVKDKRVSVNQQRFYMNPVARETDKDQNWPVPLLTSQDDTTVLISKSDDIDVIRQPFILNRNHSGFYRASYDATHLKYLGGLVRSGKLSVLDRMGLLSDTFDSAKAGYNDTATALSLLENYTNEANNVVWDVIAQNLSSVRSTMDDETLREALKPFVRKLTAKQVKRLGWVPKENEPYFDTLMRPMLLGMASLAEEPTVVKEAISQFKTMKRPEDVAPDLRGVVYGTAVRNGGKPEFDKLLKMHNETKSSEEQTTISAALTGFEDKSLYKRALGLITTDTVRLQDVTYWVAYSFMNRHAKQATWEWMKNHWPWLLKNFGTDLSFYRFPIYAARPFYGENFLKAYKEFFATVTNPGLERSINQGIEIIEWQTAWRDRDLSAIKKYFTDQVGK